MSKWKGASHMQAGWSHENAGLPCQDAVLAKETEDYLLAVVSDGVGSLPNSHIASNAAVEAVDKWFGGRIRDLKRKKFDLGWVAQNLIGFVRESIKAAAKNCEISPDSMDCNLAFAFVLPDNYALLGSLGDCAVCVVARESYVMTSASGLANATDTILSPNSEMRLRMEGRMLHDGSVKGFILTTDGLEGEIYTKNSEVIRKRAEVYINALLEDRGREQLASLTKQLPESFDDDIGVAVLSCSIRPIRLPDDPTWLCTCETRNSLSDSRCRNCGADFVELYKDIVKGKSREAFFLKLNRSPNEERARLGLPPLKVEDKPANAEAAHQNAEETGAQRSAIKNTGSNADNIEKLINNMTGGEKKEKSEVVRHKRRERIWERTAAVETQRKPDGQGDDGLRGWKIGTWLPWVLVLVCLVACIVMLFWGLRESRRNQILAAQMEKYQTLMEHEYAGPILKGIELMQELECEPSELYEVAVAVAFIWDEPGSDEENTASLREGDVVKADTGQMEQDTINEEVWWIRVTMPDKKVGWCQWDQLRPWLSGGQS